MCIARLCHLDVVCLSFRPFLIGIALFCVLLHWFLVLQLCLSVTLVHHFSE